MADRQMQSLGEAHGVRWWWAEPGHFEKPGVYYWNGSENILVMPVAAPSPVALQGRDAYREHLAEQAEVIDVEGLVTCLTHLGIASPEGGLEAAAAQLGSITNHLIAGVHAYFKAGRASLHAPQGRDELSPVEEDQIAAQVLRMADTMDEAAHMAIRATWQAARASLPAGGVVEPVAWRWRNSLGEVVTDWLEYQHQTAEGVKKQVADEGGTVEYAYATPQPSETQGRRQMTDEQRRDLITNWFAEDWAIKKAHGLLDDYEARHGIPASPQDEGGATA